MASILSRADPITLRLSARWRSSRSRIIVFQASLFARACSEVIWSTHDESPKSWYWRLGLAGLGTVCVKLMLPGHGRLQLRLGCPIAPHEALRQALHDSRVSVGVVKPAWQFIAANVVFAVVAIAVFLEHRPCLSSTSSAQREPATTAATKDSGCLDCDGHSRLQVVGYSVGGEGRGCQWVGFQLEAQLLCGSSHEKYGKYPRE